MKIFVGSVFFLISCVLAVEVSDRKTSKRGVFNDGTFVSGEIPNYGVPVLQGHRFHGARVPSSVAQGVGVRKVEVIEEKPAITIKRIEEISPQQGSGNFGVPTIQSVAVPVEHSVPVGASRPYTFTINRPVPLGIEHQQIAVPAGVHQPLTVPINRPVVVPVGAPIALSVNRPVHVSQPIYLEKQIPVVVEGNVGGGYLGGQLVQVGRLHLGNNGHILGNPSAYPQTQVFHLASPTIAGNEPEDNVKTW